jgi:hypothetical protein
VHGCREAAAGVCGLLCAAAELVLLQLLLHVLLQLRQRVVNLLILVHLK